MNFFRKYLLILLIIVPLFQAHSYPYFHFNAKNIRISKDSYSRYIRPQIRSIVQEFYFVLKKLDPLSHDFIDLKNKVSKFKSRWKEWSKECKPQIPECKKSLEGLNRLITKIDRKVLMLQGSIGKKKKKNNDAEELLLFSRSLDNISNLIYKTKNQLRIKNFKYITPLFHKISITTEMLITKRLNKSYRGDFDFIWVNYIRIMENNILDKKDYKFFLSKLEDLNLSWNTFHMKLKKSKGEIPRNVNTTIKIMHNRWNSILKMILNS
jgi:hypothetical protein